MSHDITSDSLNQIMNAKRAKKTSLKLKRYSKFLIEILDLARNEGYLDYKHNKDSKEIEITFKMNECKAIKPRFNVSVQDIEKYVRRFLPSRNFGMIVISTNKGIMTHKKALEENLGGSLIAYFY